MKNQGFGQHNDGPRFRFPATYDIEASTDFSDRSSQSAGSRDQSPIRSRSSHWRNSPLKPMLSAIWKLEMTHRSICLPDLPAVSHVRRYSLGAVSITCSAPPCDRNSSSDQLNKDLRIFRKSKSNRSLHLGLPDTARRRVSYSKLQQWPQQFVVTLRIKPCIDPHLSNTFTDLLFAKRHLLQKSEVIVESVP